MQQIPDQLDRELLARGRSFYGTVLDGETRREMRASFWSVIVAASPRDEKDGADTAESNS